MAIPFPFPSSKAWVRAMRSANWAEVPDGKNWPLWSRNWRLLHIKLFFFHLRQSCFHQCTRFPQDWSKDLLTIPLWVLSSGPRFLNCRSSGIWDWVAWAFCPVYFCCPGFQPSGLLVTSTALGFLRVQLPLHEISPSWASDVLGLCFTEAEPRLFQTD